MGCNSVFLKKEILSLELARMNLQDTGENEISQAQKHKCYMISLIFQSVFKEINLEQTIEWWLPEAERV